MKHSSLNFLLIERALSLSIEALASDGEEVHNHPALEQLTNAQEEWKRALSYSQSRGNGLYDN